VYRYIIFNSASVISFPRPLCVFLFHTPKLPIPPIPSSRFRRMA
jgi:hypothetical protein